MNKQGFPNDATGDALRRLRDDGADLSKPHEIDFYVTLPNEASGREFVKIALKEGFEVNLDKNDEDAAWTCCCTNTMVLEHDLITEVEGRLDALATPFGGHVDGWGAFPVD